MSEIVLHNNYIVQLSSMCNTHCVYTLCIWLLDERSLHMHNTLIIMCVLYINLTVLS